MKPLSLQALGPAVVLCLSLAIAAPAGWAHKLDQKSFGELKASTKNFAHATSKKLAKEAAPVKMNQPMPAFALKDVYGKDFDLRSFKGKLTLIVLADTQCPCVKAIEMRLVDLSKKYAKQGLQPVYVFSKPGETALQIARFMQSHRIPFPAVLDQKQQLLRLLDGQCSSELYLFDKKTKLRYHGRLDDSIFDPKAVKSPDLEKAVISLSKGKPVARPELPAMGCAIPRI